MKLLEYTDERGRKYMHSVPEGTAPEDAGLYPLYGPADVADVLGLPEETATRLHNELFLRGLYTLKEIRRQPGSLLGVVQSVLGADAQRLEWAFAQFEAGEPTLVTSPGTNGRGKEQRQ